MKKKMCMQPAKFKKFAVFLQLLLYFRQEVGDIRGIWYFRFYVNA